MICRLYVLYLLFFLFFVRRTVSFVSSDWQVRELCFFLGLRTSQLKYYFNICMWFKPAGRGQASRGLLLKCSEFSCLRLPLLIESMQKNQQETGDKPLGPENSHLLPLPGLRGCSWSGTAGTRISDTSIV